LACIGFGNDLCCGTGDIALALARRGFRVVGVDFSLPMLRVAHARSLLPVPSICQPAAVGAQTASATELRSSGSNVLWLLGDALSLSISPQSVDLVAISYGLRNLADIPAGLTEISRVLQPGGRLLILDFGKPAHCLWRELYFAYLKTCVPVLGWIFCGDPAAYGYILASLRTYPAQAGIADALREAGFAQVHVRSFLGGVTSIHSVVKPR
jgi:demethylmenaquinone methyltransferase/2-methoxy-6-polyprenyl-1,4-benzoquinol methylase